MMDHLSLADRERRAQHGIIEFAEEMKVIRDEGLYPDAGKSDAWKLYCKERWGQSHRTVEQTIQALPVLRRASSAPGVRAAAAVASLDEAVQDVILEDTTLLEVAAKAKAVRKVKKVAENEGREATVDEQVEVAKSAKSKKPKKPKHRSKFTSQMEQAYFHVQEAADIAQGDTLTDVENDYAWSRIAKVRYEVGRIEERLYRPEIAKDADEEFAELLGGEGQ